MYLHIILHIINLPLHNKPTINTDNNLGKLVLGGAIREHVILNDICSEPE